MPPTLIVADYMAKSLVTVTPETSVYDAIVLLVQRQISGVPVVDQAGELVGVLSERDCMETFVNAQYHELPNALVKDLMSTELQTVDPQTSILQVAKLFLQSKIRRLPVLEEGRLVGQISRRDVLRAVGDASRMEG